MSRRLPMPEVATGVTEAVVVQWYVAPGQAAEPDGAAHREAASAPAPSAPPAPAFHPVPFQHRGHP